MSTLSVISIIKEGATLTAKEELNTLRILDCRIKASLQQLETLQSTVERVTATTDKVIVTGGSGSRDDLLVRLIEMRAECNEAIDEFVDYKRLIMARINRIDDPLLAEILIERYVDRYSWYDIALNLNYGLRHVHKLHGLALQEYTAKMAHNGTS